MNRRMVGAGLGRRPGARGNNGAASGGGSAPATPLSILGSKLAYWYPSRNAADFTLNGGDVAAWIEAVAAANAVLDDGTVTSQIKRIRAKFAAVDPTFGAIQTVYGMGYRWQSDAAPRVD